MITRRSFLAALGIGTATAILAPSSWLPQPIAEAELAAPVQFSATDLQQMARYALGRLSKRYPGHFRKATRNEANHFFGVDFLWEENDPAVLKSILDACIDQLANECKERGITAFASPELPRAVEHSIVVRNKKNIALRIVRAYNFREARMINRLDIQGAA